MKQQQDTGIADGDPNADPGPIDVAHKPSIQPLTIAAGTWELRITATDHVGNESSATGTPFKVTHDIQPPRTEASAGRPRPGPSAEKLQARKRVRSGWPGGFTR